MLTNGSLVKVENLVIVSPTAYERYVPQKINIVEPTPYINRFSSASLEKLREAVLDSLDLELSRNNRIYLSRSNYSNNLRVIENSEEVEVTLKKHKFMCIDTGSANFSEQVSACSKADLIVAPIGASLANMIFAPVKCRVIVLAPYYFLADYHYYTNLASALNLDLVYILGKQVGPNIQPMYMNYHINIDDLKSFL